jgi:hypothetical protein
MFGMEPSPASSGDQRVVAMRALLQIVEMGLRRGCLWSGRSMMRRRSPTIVGRRCMDGVAANGRPAR